MPPSPLARLRKICLALPSATEVEAWGAPTFRCGRIFAMYAHPDDHHGAGRHGVWLKAAPGNQQLMVRDRPDRFFVPPYVGPSGWIGVWIDKRPPWKEIEKLIEESWRLVAPKKLLKSLLTLLLFVALGASLPEGAVAHDIALVGVTTIDGTGGPARTDQTIVIRDSTIAAIGDRDEVIVPAGARVLQLAGRTVIPGIVGMHDHTHMPGITFMSHTAPRLYLASGVTTIMTAGSAEAREEIALARAIARGERVGPRIYPSAPYITGPGGNGPMTKPATPREAREFVREWATAGATWIKLYRHTAPEIAAAVIDEAHLRGLKVTGHLCSLTFSDAVGMGINSIEHGLISATDFVADKQPGVCVPNAASIDALDLDAEPVADLIRTMVRENVTLTSTLAIIESHFPHRPQGDQRALDAMTPAWVGTYHARQQQLHESAATSRYTPALFAKFIDFERRFVAAGGRLVAGPDPGRHVLPGFGDQRNFELLVESGFSTADAIRVMTANGAAALGASASFGTLRRGLRADLVVLSGDLRSHPSAIRDPEMVFKDGVPYDPASLLEEVRGQVGAR